MSTVQLSRAAAVQGAPVTVQLARASASAVGVIAGVTVQLAAASVAVVMGPPVTVQLARAWASTSTTGAGVTVQLARVVVSSQVPATLEARAGADQAVTPFVDLVLDPTASTGRWGDPQWEQVQNGSPTVTLELQGGAAVYRAPARDTGYPLVFRLTVSDGANTSTDTVTHRVFPWVMDWELRDSTWVPVPEWETWDNPNPPPPVIIPSPPTAVFAAVVTGRTVTFTDQSTGQPGAWLWNFGDGGTSTERNPVHLYGAAGTYTVTLRATNSGGTGPASTQTVTALPGLFPDAGVYPDTGQTVRT